MSRSPESSSTTPDTAPKAEGFEVAGAFEFGQEQEAPASAESRVSKVLRSIAEGAYKIGDKLHDAADKRESRADSKSVDKEAPADDKQERETSKESTKAIFRGFGRNARKAIIGARVNLAVGKAKAEDAIGAAKDKFDSLSDSAKDKFNSAKDKAAELRDGVKDKASEVKDKATELRDAAKDKLDAAKKSVNSFGAPKRDPGDISDIVTVGERASNPSRKTYHRENGKFMTREEMDLIRAHQDQIREGMRELNGTKGPNIVDNIKQNVTERAASVRSSVESFLFGIADRIKNRKDQIKASLLEQFTSKKADVISEYLAAKEVITEPFNKIEDAYYNKAEQIKQYFADRKSEAEARKAARAESREQARADRARNREIDNRVVRAETARRLENREARTIDPVEARRRGRIATRAAALASAVRVGYRTGRETYDALK